MIFTHNFVFWYVVIMNYTLTICEKQGILGPGKHFSHSKYLVYRHNDMDLDPQKLCKRQT